MNTYAAVSPADYQFNLSDFALFLSVMKNKRAYECTLSIILDEPDIKIQEVKVEQVILNQTGKRAIRLDAWATSTDQRQFNMEMQNDSSSDDLSKRSRYYQSMIDNPDILVQDSRILELNDIVTEVKESEETIQPLLQLISEHTDWTDEQFLNYLLKTP